MVNTGGTQRFSLTDNGRSLAYTLPAGAVATFVWNLSGGGEPTGPIDTIAWYGVANTNSGACLDATDWGTINGTLLQQWSCGDGANEKWQFRSTGDGYYKVVNQHNSKSWDVDGGSGATADGCTCGTTSAAPTSSGVPSPSTPGSTASWHGTAEVPRGGRLLHRQRG